MSGERTDSRDLILVENQFSFVKDKTNGNIKVFVGPKKTSLESTDATVVFDDNIKDFKEVPIQQAVQLNRTAPEGYYIELFNPAKNAEFPKRGGESPITELDIGRKIIVRGPANFPLWPGQMARVVRGHLLRSNQYILCQVYNPEAAEKHWHEAVIEPQAETAEDGETTKAKTAKAELPKPDSLVMGQIIVIRGTDTSFFIPPTGVKVLKEGNRFIREAVTLERLEYCILLDEDGNKRYVKGPDVVFPEPTEVFLERNGSRKFKAFELNPISGIHLKTIADFEDKEGLYGNPETSYKVGDEMFVTGKLQPVFYPREELAMVTYGDSPVIYAIAIPDGEARYVLNRLNGKIRLEEGPSMFLPNPIEEVIVQRVLSPELVELWYPGNEEALKINEERTIQIASNLTKGKKTKGRGIDDDLRNLISRGSSGGDALRASYMANALADGETYTSGEIASTEWAGDEFSRSTKYTPPRSVTLNTKYDGAITVKVWNGYAVCVVNAKGERDIVVGPKTRLLKYDEFLEKITLSKGTPKSSKNLKETVYLRVKNNKISDIVEVETSDLVKSRVLLSYRLNFEGDEPAKWFDVENYVGFMTDHLRSLIRNEARKHEIKNFYADYINIIRDCVLGAQTETTEGETPKKTRTGRIFSETNMIIYDVEVLSLDIMDEDINYNLIQAERETFNKVLRLQSEERELELTKEIERVKRERYQAEHDTYVLQAKLKSRVIESEHANRMAVLEADIEADEKRHAQRLADQEVEVALKNVNLDHRKAVDSHELELAQKYLDQNKEALIAEAEAMAKKAEAISPQLAESLRVFGDKLLAGQLAESVAPYALIKGSGLWETAGELLASASPRLQKLFALYNGERKDFGDVADKKLPEANRDRNSE